MSPNPKEPQRTNPDEPYNAADPQAVQKATVKAKDIERRRIAGLKAICDNPDARLYLWDVLEFCGISRVSFTGNSETFFLEGGRNVGLRIQADLTKHFPESYIAMMREAQNDNARGWRPTSKPARADA